MFVEDKTMKKQWLNVVVVESEHAWNWNKTNDALDSHYIPTKPLETFKSRFLPGR